VPVGNENVGEPEEIVGESPLIQTELDPEDDIENTKWVQVLREKPTNCHQLAYVLSWSLSLAVFINATLSV
jgi:hypothetical protein